MEREELNIVGNLTVDVPGSGIEGLDELANALGVGEATQGIVLEGKSGKLYGLVDILAADLALRFLLARSAHRATRVKRSK